MTLLPIANGSHAQCYGQPVETWTRWHCSGHRGGSTREIVVHGHGSPWRLARAQSGL